jgi:putative hydrolase of the HAD superfamily
MVYGKGKIQGLNGIRVISFDGDGTLWDFQRVMRHSLQCVLDELLNIDSALASALDIEGMIKTRNMVAAELKGKITNLEAIRLEAFKRTLQDAGKPDDILASHLNRIYLTHRFGDVELFPDVLPALEPLRHKYRLGLLSNGNSYPERCGLEGVFDFVVFSQDHGVEKPDPELFNIALSKAGCSRSQFLHVGDSLINDVMGATGAGIPCVWLNRSQVTNTSGITVDYEIESLIELLEIV